MKVEAEGSQRPKISNLDWFSANGLDLESVQRFQPLEAHRSLPRLEVYVDETGDRNFKRNRQSDWFAMTAVVIPHEYTNHLQVIVQGMKHHCNLPDDKFLHWVKHFRRENIARRNVALDLFTGFRRIKVVHVVIHKPSIAESAHMRRDTRGVYHYATALLTERIGHVAANWEGGPRRARLNLGVVGGVNHALTMKYLHHVANEARAKQEDHWFDYLQWPFKWFSMTQLEGLQAADMYSGFLTTALNEGRHEFVSRYADRIAEFAPNKPLGWGFKVFPSGGWGSLRYQPWWTEFEVALEGP